MLARTAHAIEYDEVHDEIFIPQMIAQAVLVFSGSAMGEVSPIRIIQGDKTRLRQSDRLAIDTVNNELYVPDGDKVLVFPRDANGNVAPTRILQGPETQLGASAIAIDPVHNLLIVSGSGRSGGSRTGHLLIFNRTDQGNAKPRAVVRGPHTMLDEGGARNIRVYPANGWILVAYDGVQGENATGRSFVGVWSIYDNGDVPPRWTIGGPQGVLVKPRGVAFNVQNKEVIVSDKELNAVVTYSFPELFEQDSARVERNPLRAAVNPTPTLTEKISKIWEQLASFHF